MPSITKITLITMSCGLLVSAIIFKIVYDHQVNLWKKEFVNQAQKTLIRLKGEMKNNEIILLDILSFYDSSPKITRKAFKSYVSPILKRNSFIQALEWAPRVSMENRKKIEEEAHSEGFSNFQISELAEPGKLVEAGARHEYYPVFFMEPLVGNEPALGFDLASESKRLKAIVGSIKSKEVYATDKIHLIQSESMKDGLLVFTPYYGGIVHRERKLKGFIVGVYRLEDMVSNAIDPYVEKGMNITIFDGSDISSQNELFSISKADADLIRYKNEIVVFGKSWMVLFRGDGSFRDGVKWHPPIASAGALLLLFLLISIGFEINDSRTRQKLLSDSNKNLEELSNLDSLTKLANRRYFDKIIEKEVRRSVREKSCISLILLDVDHFKKYNDSHGHLIGDECLKQVAEMLLKCIDRSHDLAARFGGEEFAVILPSTELNGGLVIAERLRSRIEGLDLSDSESSKIPPVTISLGLVAASKDQKPLTSEALIAQADKALYEAKEQGRNRTVHLKM